MGRYVDMDGSRQAPLVTGHAQSITCLAMPDSSSLAMMATTSQDGVLHIWQLPSSPDSWHQVTTAQPPLATHRSFFVALLLDWPNLMMPSWLGLGTTQAGTAATCLQGSCVPSFNLTLACMLPSKPCRSELFWLVIC